MLFDSNSEKVSLSKEIQYIKNYIALQKFRISQKKNIYIRFNYDGEPNGFHVEPLLFIPFVENAFKHGISYNETSIIDITLRISENKLTFEALNSCPKYQQKSLLEDKKESSGIGCTNVARRLKLLYPEKHSLTLNNGDDSFSAKLELKLN
jgi:LytS/YehU family sensor histidine kinase